MLAFIGIGLIMLSKQPKKKDIGTCATAILSSIGVSKKCKESCCHPLFIFGLKRQGKTFTVYSIFAVTVYSLASFMIMDVLPIDVSFISPLAGSDLLLCAVFGGVISGVGSGMTIRFGGATDGIDVLSVVFAKRIGISIGTFVMLFNTLLYIICGIAIQSWILPLYSIVTYYVGSRTVDFITEGFDRAKCAMIVTVKANEISNALSENFDSSGTIVKIFRLHTKTYKPRIVKNHGSGYFFAYF
mgnify:FL=1